VKNDEIVAKIWLIGRSYSASIERRKSAEGIGDDFYKKKVGPAIRRSKIDKWLNSIKSIKNPGSAETIEVHKDVMALFRSITGLDKRSLASKYLHFHRPDIFFIYDSRVKRSIAKLVPNVRRLPDLEANNYDREYKDYVRRCLSLLEQIKKVFGVTLKPRELDKLLISFANDEMRKKTKGAAIRHARSKKKYKNY